MDCSKTGKNMSWWNERDEGEGVGEWKMDAKGNGREEGRWRDGMGWTRMGKEGKGGIELDWIARKGPLGGKNASQHENVLGH